MRLHRLPHAREQQLGRCHCVSPWSPQVDCGHDAGWCRARLSVRRLRRRGQGGRLPDSLCHQPMPRAVSAVPLSLRGTARPLTPHPSLPQHPPASPATARGRSPTTVDLGARRSATRSPSTATSASRPSSATCTRASLRVRPGAQTSELGRRGGQTTRAPTCRAGRTPRAAASARSSRPCSRAQSAARPTAAASARLST